MYQLIFSCLKGCSWTPLNPLEMHHKGVKNYMELSISIYRTVGIEFPSLYALFWEQKKRTTWVSSASIALNALLETSELTRIETSQFFQRPKMAHFKYIQFLMLRRENSNIWKIGDATQMRTSKITQLALKVSFGCDVKILVFIEKSHKKVQLWMHLKDENLCDHLSRLNQWMGLGCCWEVALVL